MTTLELFNRAHCRVRRAHDDLRCGSPDLARLRLEEAIDYMSQLERRLEQESLADASSVPLPPAQRFV